MLSRIFCKFAFSKTAAASAPQVTASSLQNLNQYLIGYQQKRVDTGLRQDLDFEKDLKPALEQYQALGFTKRELKSIFDSKITGLCVNNGKNERLKQDIIQISAFLKSEYSLDNPAIHRIVQNNHSVLSITQDEFKERLQLLKQILKISDVQAIQVLVRYSKLFTSNMDKQVGEFKRLLSVWTGITDEQVASLVIKHPFLVDVNKDKINGNIKVLSLKGFIGDHFYNLVLANPDVLIQHPAHLEQCFHFTVSLNLKRKQLLDLYGKFPDLLTLCPITIIPIKIKMLRNAKVLSDNLKDLVLNHTSLFLCSIGSIDLKSRYLNQRAFALGKPKNLAIYYSLSYSGVIRPRCEAAIKLGKTINLDEDLSLSEEEFVTKTGIPKAEIDNVKAEFPEHLEKDYKKKFYTQIMKGV